MSDITITVTELVDGVSVESTPTAIVVTDGVFVNSGGGGGGGGAVDSVNGHTGTVVLGASDVGAATTAQGAKADTAVQPGSLGTAAALDVPATGDATTGQVVKGTDTRLADSRTPTTHTHTASQISDSTTVGRAVVTATDAAAARTAIGAGTSSLALGTTGTTAAAGNDSRLSDARTPTTHASSHASAGSDPLTIAESQVTNLVTDLAAKAPLASPTLTGTPAAPTATPGTNTTQVATTAFVTAAVVGAGGYVDPLTTKGDLVTRTASATARKAVGSNGQALIADSTQTDGLIWRAIAESDVTNLTTDLAAKAPTASPTFTGTVTIPTATAADSSTKAASTAFVQGELTAKAPLASPTFTGTPAAPTVAGTSDSTTKIATTAFVQAVAALLAPLASPALTGNPTAPTQTALNNSTRVATTAYVDAAVTAGPIDATKVTHTVNAQTASYTLVLGDAGKFVTLSNASAMTLTVPPNSSVAFPVGTMLDGAQIGAGQVTVTAGAGVTINATPGLKVAAQYGTFGLLKVATDTWLAFGRLSA